MKVILPCWLINEDLVHLTQNAIASLGKCELIIIDNASPIGGGFLRENADLYIRNKENLGYAKAVNQGLRMCNFQEIVAISNNDIRVSEGWDRLSENVLAKYPKVGSVHFKMIPYDEPFKPGEEYWVDGKERWCSSSFFVVRNVQLYDENFINNCDDWDFWKRIRSAGWKQAYTNVVQYQHMDSFSQTLNPNRKEDDIKSREYFKSKWGKTPEELFEEEFPGELAKPWKPMP